MIAAVFKRLYIGGLDDPSTARDGEGNLRPYLAEQLRAAADDASVELMTGDVDVRIPDETTERIRELFANCLVIQEIDVLIDLIDEYRRAIDAEIVGIELRSRGEAESDLEEQIALVASFKISSRIRELLETELDRRFSTEERTPAAPEEIVSSDEDLPEDENEEGSDTFWTPPDPDAWKPGGNDEEREERWWRGDDEPAVEAARVAEQPPLDETILKEAVHAEANMEEVLFEFHSWQTRLDAAFGVESDDETTEYQQTQRKAMVLLHTLSNGRLTLRGFLVLRNHVLMRELCSCLDERQTRCCFAALFENVAANVLLNCDAFVALYKREIQADETHGFECAEELKQSYIDELRRQLLG